MTSWPLDSGAPAARGRSAGVTSAGGAPGPAGITLTSSWSTVIPFQRQLGIGAAGRLGAELDQILPPDDLSLDEAALEIGVDDAGRLRGPRAALDRPGPALVLAGGEEGDEVEERVGGARDGVQPR